MTIEWTKRAKDDLVRFHLFLAPTAPAAAARVVQDLLRAPGRLIDFPRIGEKLAGYDSREVRRIVVGHYELRYELVDDRIIVLRLWHHREDRPLDRDEA